MGKRFTPYAERVRYAGHGRHHASARRRPFAWFVSLLRDAGEFVYGSLILGEV